MQLYAISENLKQLNAMLEEGVDPEQLKDALNDVDEAFEEKAKHILFLIRNIESNIEAVKSEECRLADNRKAMERQVSGIKEYLLDNMAKTGKTKIDNGLMVASYIKPKPALVLNNEGSIPDEYKKIKVSSSFDKKLILDDLKDGKSINGASIGESKAGLKIK